MLAATRQQEESVQEAPGNRTLVVGLGATGLAVAEHLAGRGRDVLVVDSRAAPPALDALRRRWPRVPFVAGRLDARWLDGVCEVVLSPGLAYDTPLAAEARQRGIPVVGDIELFARAARAPVLAVTGSNGKSTVVTLLGRLLAALQVRAAVGGNLGPPALELLADDVEAYVLEISSFQMETTTSLSPRVAAVLNVSADHLDRHGSLERYASLKAKLLEAAATAVYNRDDPQVRPMGLAHRRAISFSAGPPKRQGFGIATRRGRRWLARGAERLLPTAALRIRGTHNEANALAALAMIEGFGLDYRRALPALEHFEGLPHRCQWVGERGGVQFINDSKGTNVGATLAALQGLEGPLVLIAGGVGKGADFSALAGAARGKVKAAVLIGEAASALEHVLAPICAVRRAAGMAEAVATAQSLATAGDTVLLSPACASQDMFADYRDRGRSFARTVEALG